MGKRMTLLIGTGSKVTSMGAGAISGVLLYHKNRVRKLKRLLEQVQTFSFED